MMLPPMGLNIHSAAQSCSCPQHPLDTMNSSTGTELVHKQGGGITRKPALGAAYDLTVLRAYLSRDAGLLILSRSLVLLLLQKLPSSCPQRCPAPGQTRHQAFQAHKA